MVYSLLLCAWTISLLRTSIGDDAMKVGKDGKISLNALFPHKDTSDVFAYKLDPTKDGLMLTLLDELGQPIKDLPPVKKLRCTKNLIEMTRHATQRCFNNALKVVAKNKGIKEDEVRFNAKTTYKDEVDHVYRQQICKLETEVLEAILLCHNKGKFARAQITLRCISDELANRAILNDSSRKK